MRTQEGRGTCMNQIKLIRPLNPLLLLEVVLGPALEADLAKGERDEQTQMPCHQPQPAVQIQQPKLAKAIVPQRSEIVRWLG